MPGNQKKLRSVLNGFAAMSLIVIWIPALVLTKGCPNIASNKPAIINYTANASDRLFKEKSSKWDSIKITVPNADKDFFYVELRDSLKVEPSTYDSASEIIEISDIEGNFNALYGFLIANKVMDKNYNWIFGSGHIVFLGDFVDRGTQSIQVLWLIYKLEGEAIKQGGKVHYILGNHELLNIQGVGYGENTFIKDEQYNTTSVPFDESHKISYSAKSELGKWLRAKNSIEKIGNYTFVHGGLSPKILSFKPDLDKINNTIRENIDHDLYNDPGKNKFANFLIGREGPLWFRGLAIKYKYYNKVSKSEFKRIQNYFNSPKIVIGHTGVSDIQADFDGALIKTDVIHGREKFSGKTKGLLIQNDIEYKIDGNGNRSKL